MEHVARIAAGHADPALRAGRRRDLRRLSRATAAFVGEGCAGVLGRVDLVLPAHDSIEAAHHAPFWVERAADRRRRRRHRARLWRSTSAIRRSRRGWPRSGARLYQFLLNKWYFDELYDRLFVRPAFVLGRGLWKTGDGADHRRARARRRSPPPRSSLARGASRLQTGYVYHYAFAMLIGVVVLMSWYSSVRRSRQSSGCADDDRELADPVARHLPAAGRRRLHPARARRARTIVARNARCGGAVDLADRPSCCRCCCGSTSTRSTAAFQFVEQREWMPAVRHHLPHGRRRHLDAVRAAVDLADAALHPGELGGDRRRGCSEYMIAFLVLETMMVGTFCALDFVLFYVFFEGVLIPMFLIIGVWGGARRVYSAFKFFLYTLLGSVLMLLAHPGDVLRGRHAPTSRRCSTYAFAPAMQNWLWLAFFASFAVKVPMWPVHTWLPDAHVEAPTAGSVILAGVLLKMGGYGFLRFSLPMFPDASAYFTPLVYTLSSSPSSTPRWSRWRRRT